MDLARSVRPVQILTRWLSARAGIIAELEGSDPGYLWIPTKPGRPRGGRKPVKPGLSRAAVRTLHAAHRTLVSQVLGTPLPARRFPRSPLRRHRPVLSPDDVDATFTLFQRDPAELILIVNGRTRRPAVVPVVPVVPQSLSCTPVGARDLARSNPFIRRECRVHVVPAA